MLQQTNAKITYSAQQIKLPLMFCYVIYAIRINIEYGAVYML